MKITFAKPYLTKEDAQCAYDTILSGWVTQGPRVEEFERNFADYVGAKYAVAVSSCTAALHLAMLVSGIGRGDEVICPSMSFIATANVIRYAGARPIFAEVDPYNYNIDVNHAKTLITKKTKAILVVHQMGMPADIDAFKNLCHKYNIRLIEDAACAAGSAYRGRKIGSHSELSCFSFHPRKVITTGEGGMITTSNKGYYERLKLLRHQGMSISDRDRHLSKKTIFEKYMVLGYNYRMTDIQAAVGIKQLEKLDWLVAQRREIAKGYNQSLKDVDCIRFPNESTGYFSNYQSYSIYLRENAPLSRNKLMQSLLNSGIETRRGIMTVHREAAYTEYCKGLRLPISEDASDRSILMPLYVPMSSQEHSYVIDCLKRNLGNPHQ